MLHVITGYKGGIGKTLLSVSLALKHIHDNKKPVYLIDANSMNPDIASNIFERFHEESRSPSCMELGFKNTARRTYTTSPESTDTFNIINASRIPIKQIISNVNGKHNDKVVIVDTNSHITDLVGLPEYRSGCIDFSPPEFYWFLWGWSVPRMERMYSWTMRALYDIEEFFPYRQAIHVFNMYDLYEVDRSLFKSNSSTINSLKKIMDKIDKKFDNEDVTPSYYMLKELEEITDKIRTDLMKYIVPRDLSIEEIPDIWSQHLMDFVESHPRCVPYNILLIPTFFSELVMSIDKIVMSEPRSVDTLFTLLKPFVLFTATWIDNMKKSAMAVCNGKRNEYTVP